MLYDIGLSITYIIPAFNEEDCIAKTLCSINQFTPENINYEIIVIDNGSTDNTFDIVNESKAGIYRLKKGTIAAARNYGVKHSKGQFLIFLDADILLTEEWSKNIEGALSRLSKDELLVTGSRVLPVDNTSFLNKYWFYRMISYEAPYINSAHLITSKKLFEKIGGFTEELITAEDYDFCMKAKKAGAKIVNNPSLPVIHLGYPKTILAFMKRERWHGRQDFESMDSFKESKVAWLAAFNILSLLLFVALSVILDNYVLLFFYPLIMAGVSTLLTVYKFGLAPLSLLMGTSLIFYFYLCGRSMALIDRFIK